MHSALPEDHQRLSFTRIQFHPPKVTPLTNHAEVTAQEPFNCNSKPLLLLLLLKKIGNARPGEGDCHPISPKTPAPHYRPIEEKKRKGK